MSPPVSSSSEQTVRVNLTDKAYSESVTSITVGEITGSGMNRSTPIEMTIDNGINGATVRADMVYSFHGVSFRM